MRGRPGAAYVDIPSNVLMAPLPTDPSSATQVRLCDSTRRHSCLLRASAVLRPSRFWLDIPLESGPSRQTHTQTRISTLFLSLTPVQSLDRLPATLPSEGWRCYSRRRTPTRRESEVRRCRRNCWSPCRSHRGRPRTPPLSQPRLICSAGRSGAKFCVMCRRLSL